MVAWFAALVLHEPALGGEVFTYAQPASEASDAWRMAFEGRGARVTGPDLDKVDAFAVVDTELRVSGRMDTGVLEYPVDGTIRIRGTGLTSSEITVSLRETGTLGERVAWKGVLKRASGEVDAELALGRETADVLVQRELLQLQGASTCSAAVEALATSPWPEASRVLHDGLDVVAEPCLERMVSVVGRKPELQDYGASWLAARYSRMNDAGGFVRLAGDYPAPNEALRVALVDARLMVSPLDRRAVPERPVVLTPAPAIACRSDCCKVCDVGKACGNSCISRSYTCHKGRGCACNASQVCP
jgi:hypothetical protein